MAHNGSCNYRLLNFFVNCRFVAHLRRRRRSGEEHEEEEVVLYFWSIHSPFCGSINPGRLRWSSWDTCEHLLAISWRVRIEKASSSNRHQSEWTRAVVLLIKWCQSALTSLLSSKLPAFYCPQPRRLLLLLVLDGGGQRVYERSRLKSLYLSTVIISPGSSRA